MQYVDACKDHGSIFSLKTLWDGGSTLSFITIQKAKEMNLQGTSVRLELIKVGGVKERLNSYRYKIFLRDKDMNLAQIEVIGLNQISSEISSINIRGLVKLFPKIYSDRIERPFSGNIDCLLGYNYAAFHPVPVEGVGQLLILKNKFGYVIGGSHPAV